MSAKEKTIKNKLGLLELSSHLGNVSRACKIFGYSRNNFYRFDSKSCTKKVEKQWELILYTLSFAYFNSASLSLIHLIHVFYFYELKKAILMESPFILFSSRLFRDATPSIILLLHQYHLLCQVYIAAC